MNFYELLLLFVYYATNAAVYMQSNKIQE